MATGAFKGAGIKAANIQANLITIPASCFKECTNLATVILPETLTTIEGSAFDGCTSLQAPKSQNTDTWPLSLTRIGEVAFRQTKMGNLKFPTAKTISIGEGAFFGATITSLSFEGSNPSEYSLSSPRSSSWGIFANVKGLYSVILPAWLTTIPDCFFYGSTLKTVDMSQISSGNLNIGDEAFAYNTSLEAIRLPEKVNTIGKSCFQGCSHLNTLGSSRVFQSGKIYLPITEKINDWAFAGCGFTEITRNSWPATKTELGSGVFRDNLSLTKVSTPVWLANIPTYTFSNCQALSTLTLHEGLNGILKHALGYCVSLKSVLLPYTLTQIDEGAFSTCHLTEISIPESVKYIGKRAFARNHLTKIRFPQPENAEFTPISFGSYVFESNNDLEDFTFPAWLIKVPEGIFSSCWNLKTVTFAEGTTNIEKDAFNFCERLQLGNLPNTLKLIGISAFYGCGFKLYGSNYFLNTLYINKQTEIQDNAFCKARIKGVAFEDCTFKIGAYIMSEIRGIEEVVFAPCMTEIPEGICSGWKDLIKVTWPDRLLTIGQHAFKDCVKLDFNGDKEGNVIDMTCPPFNTVTKFDSGAFENTSITNIIWPENDQRDGTTISIGENLFKDCSKLTYGHIPHWMDNIPASLYDHCTAMSEIIWDTPSDRTQLNIGKHAFSGTAIPAIAWPDVPTVLGAGTFADCKNATAIIWPQNPVKLDSEVFRNTGISGELRSPETLPSYITWLPYAAFAGTNLTKVTIPERITGLHEFVFADCKQLKAITIESSPTVIPAGFAARCNNLESFTAVNPITEIGDEAFLGCSELEDIQISASPNLTLIGQKAFDGCTSLKSFPNIIGAATKLDNRVFNECTNLTNITIPGTIPWDAFKDDLSLQSVEIRSDVKNPYLHIDHSAFDKAPLLGVSYDLNARNLNYIQTYKGIDRGENTEMSQVKGILLCKRDNKYKLIEKNYDRVWEIVEQPDIAAGLKLYGDITSNFESGWDHNEYTTALRWEVVESDLNPNGDTEYYLYRCDGDYKVNPDGTDNMVKIATVTISPKELLPDGINDQNIQTTEALNKYHIKVVKADGSVVDLSNYGADFQYETDTKDLYVLVYAKQHGSLYYNTKTSHRIGLNENLGATSWFLYVDKFNSPILNEGGVPDHYTYMLRKKAFRYNIPVNNEDYGIGADGKHWHWESVEPESNMFECKPEDRLVVHTSMAVPSLSLEGLYFTEDEIAADKNGSGPLSTAFSDCGKATLRWEFADPSHITHKLKDLNTTDWILTDVEICEVVTSETDGVISIISSPRKKTDIKGMVSGWIYPLNDGKAQIGSSFQTITHTNGRGTFGSAIVTIPEIPTLEIAVKSSSENNVITNTVTIKPDNLDRIKHSNPVMPEDGTYKFGIWRNITETEAAEPKALAEGDGETILENVHFHGENAFMNSTFTPDPMVYQDVAEVAQESASSATYKSDYRVRMYVQPKDDPSKYMVIEARNYDTENVVIIPTGVNDITGEYGDVRYYNLQGIEVAEPTAGNIYIRVDGTGSHKAIYTHP